MTVASTASVDFDRVPLEAIIRTADLSTRPCRAANHEGESRALTELMQALASASDTVLQNLAETTLRLCNAQSAGISLLEESQNQFVWRALAGQWQPFLGGVMPRHGSPCGTVLDRDGQLLLVDPARHYAIPSSFDPPIVEALLVPFHVNGTPVGTVWALKHDRNSQFDLEDLRLLKSLSQFAAAAYVMLTAREAERVAIRELRAKGEELETLADTSAVGLTRCDRNLRFRSVNRAYAEFLSLPRREIIGRSLPEVLGEQAFQAVRPYVERVLAGESVSYEKEVPLGRGRRFIHATYSPDLDEHGSVIGWVASVMDITDRRRMQQIVERSAQQKDALYQLADRLHRATSLREVYDAALRAIADALQCDRGSILLFDESGVMRFVSWVGLSGDYRRITEGHSPWTRDQLNAQPISVDNVAAAELPTELRTTIAKEGIAALAFIPLVVKGKLIGKFMTYYDEPHSFSHDELELSLAVARQLAFAIERYRAQTQLGNHARELALITDTAPVFIAYCDTSARFKFVNKVYAQRFGMTPDACIGKHISEVIGPRAYESIHAYVEKVVKGATVEFEISVPYDSIGDHFMHCSYAPQFDEQGQVQAFVAAITDITERRTIEQALRNSEEKLKEADRRKDEFLAMLAHELRNPLAPISNAVQLLHMDKSADPVQRQARGIIDRQTSRLSRLVDDLLEVSRISTGRIQLHMERVAIGGVVERAIETVRPLIEQHRHTLEVTLPSSPLWIRADAARLEQVLVNLLNNAAKYTDDGGRIELSVSAEDDQALIRVADTGIGIDAELLPRVFDLFTQSERSLDRSRGGLGIGLSLVQRLVAMHGGTVHARSVVGQGSEFDVKIPSLPASSDESVPRVTTTVAGRVAGLSILVVDDNADAALTLAMLLKACGHEVSVAHEGMRAIEIARETRPHVVFLDIGLPELDGYEVGKRLRALYSSRTVVLVALTGYGQQADRDRSLQAGFDHHLVKPADLSQLQAILDHVAQALAFVG